jgi:hypothetical protein
MRVATMKKLKLALVLITSVTAQAEQDSNIYISLSCGGYNAETCFIDDGSVSVWTKSGKQVFSELDIWQSKSTGYINAARGGSDILITVPKSEFKQVIIKKGWNTEYMKLTATVTYQGKVIYTEEESAKFGRITLR